MDTTMLRTSESSGSDAEEPGSSTSGEVPPEPGRTRQPAESEDRIELDPEGLSEEAALQLRAGILEVLPLLPRSVERLGIRIVKDPEMTQIHDRWKHQPTTTDVVTFDLSDSSDGPMRVDVALCLDEAERQSKVRGHGVVDELLLYVIHGLLHCCGHDDQDETSSSAMHREEDRLLQAIGRDPVYARGEES